jgi:hypothetical protein
MYFVFLKQALGGEEGVVWIANTVQEVITRQKQALCEKIFTVASTLHMVQLRVSANNAGDQDEDKVSNYEFDTKH